MLSIIIPANNEEGYIAACLDALAATSPLPDTSVEIIVAANGCTDATVDIASSYEPIMAAQGWSLVVLDIPEGGKLNALNKADATAKGADRAYLDADVVLSPGVLSELTSVLARDGAVYTSGKLTIAPAQTWVTRAYARVWQRVPFMTDCVPGAGLFAVNAEGRARWGAFPDIISDDTFIRLNFTPAERIGIAAPYTWPMVEGFSNLVKVRRRQDVGVDEVAEKYPELLQNDDKPEFGLSRLMRIVATDPIGFAVYASVAVAVKLGKKTAGSTWSRGR
jgi:glycosyltransferase involved in cell wall biosynthesis